VFIFETASELHLTIGFCVLLLLLLESLKSHLRLSSKSPLFLSSENLYEFIFSPIRAICSAHFDLVHLVILIIFVEFRSLYTLNFRFNQSISD
jgi:hypothetical protein